MSMDFDPGQWLLLAFGHYCPKHDISKAQYLRQLKKWGFEKNSSSDQWKKVAMVVRKRKSRGKDSEVFIKDDRISDQKLRKEISRYGVHREIHECSSW